MLTLIVLYFALIEPFYGYKKYAQFREKLKMDPGSRVAYYRFVLYWLWGFTVYLFIAYWIKGIPFSTLGFHAVQGSSFMNGIILALLIGTVVPVILARLSRTFQDKITQQLAALQEFLPATKAEKRYWVFIAFSAGFCEEILFRSFMFYYFTSLWPDIPLWLLIAGTSLIFGLGHTYQGFKGVVSTAFLGAIFAWIYYSTNSVIPGIVIHFLFDLRILAFVREPKKRDFSM